ncbi:MAG: ABC transporter permease [Candidatus Dormibacteria bacterium]
MLARRALLISALKIYFRSRSALFWNLALPILIMTIFGVLNFGGAGTVNVGVVDQSQSRLSAAIIDALGKVSVIKLHEGSLDAEKAAVQKGDRDLVIVFPSDESQNAIAYLDQGRPQQAQVAMAVVTQVIDQVSFQVGHVAPAYRLSQQSVDSRNLTYVDFLVPGIIAMSVMQTGLFSVIFVFVQLKQRGVLRRLAATPMRVGDFLFAQVMTRLVIAALQVAVLLAVGVFAFHIHFSGDVLTVMLLAVVGSATFIALGLAISGRASREETAAPIANLVAMPMMFLSGVFFPRDVMPVWLQGITQYFPLTYMADALRNVATNAQSLWDVRFDLVGMVVWLAICAMLAVRMFRWQTV